MHEKINKGGIAPRIRSTQLSYIKVLEDKTPKQQVTKSPEGHKSRLFKIR